MAQTTKAVNTNDVIALILAFFASGHCILGKIRWSKATKTTT